MNRLSPKAKANKPKIIKMKAGELGPVDCFYLSKDLLVGDNHRYYLVAIVDSGTRITWVELIPNLKSLTVMFVVLKGLNLLASIYSIQFKEMLSANGADPRLRGGRGSGRQSKNKQTKPFELMLNELDIKHRYTRPYRPQTNGKVERFWRTIADEVIEAVVYQDITELKTEIQLYLSYYNEQRSHGGLDGQNRRKVWRRRE